MRRRLALVLVVVAAAALAIAVVLVRPMADRPPGDDRQAESFSGLQPLADDLAWVYRTEPADLADPNVPLVIAVVGREAVRAGG